MTRNLRLSPVQPAAALQLTKSVEKRLAAVLLLMASVVGGRALFVFTPARHMPLVQRWLHVLPGVVPFFFLALWLLFEGLALSAPCAAALALQGAWIMCSSFLSKRPDHDFLGFLIGLALWIPAAIEMRSLLRRKAPPPPPMP